MITLDTALEAGDAAFIAATCLQHPGMIFIPDRAAAALHEVSRTGALTPEDHRLLRLATDFLRRVEIYSGRGTDGIANQ